MRGRTLGRAIQRWVLGKDRAFQILQGAARFDTELGEHRASGGAVGLERLRLPAGPIEREHELPAQALP